LEIGAGIGGSKGGGAIWPWPPHYDFREGPAPQAAEEIVKGGEGKKEDGRGKEGEREKEGKGRDVASLTLSPGSASGSRSVK